MRRYLLLAIGLVALAILAVAFRKPLKRWYRLYTLEVSTGRFQDPEGLAVDAAGNTHVTDSGLLKTVPPSTFASRPR